MSRQNRTDLPNYYFHITNRGVNKETIFIGEEDYYFFLNNLSFLLNNSDMLLTAYCLMPNHFHLLLYRRVVSLAQFMHRLETNYALYFNRRYDRVGHLFQDRFNSRIIHKEEYLVNVINYIHNNPVKESFVEKPEDWPYSSAGDYLGIEKTFQKEIEVPLIRFSKFEEFKDLKFEKEIFEKDYYIGTEEENLSVEKRSKTRQINYFIEKREKDARNIETEIVKICKNFHFNPNIFSVDKKGIVNFKEKRNKMIVELYKKGFRQADIARFFSLTKARISQIIKHNEN